jgi:hypothetical protein
MISEAARKKSLRANKLWYHWYGYYGVKLACGITVVIRPDSLEHPNIKMPARQDGRQLGYFRNVRFAGELRDRL